MKRILISGAGGFIGGYLASHFLKNDQVELICADIKPKEFWFQLHENSINYSFDLKDYENSLKATENVDHIFNLACNISGMDLLKNNKAECMLSVLVNTNLLRAAKKTNVKNFFLQVHVSITQTKTNFHKRT